MRLFLPPVSGPIALLEGIYRFVPSLVRIDRSAVEPPPNATQTAEPTTEQGTIKATGGGGLQWREFRSLSAALGLPPRAPDSSLLSPRGIEGEGGGGATEVASAPEVESSSATAATASAVPAGETTGARRRVLKHQDQEDQEGEAFLSSKFCTSTHS